MIRVYLDVCCLNRPFDDQRQDRIRLESEALLLILSRIENAGWEWVSSQVVDLEIQRTPDPDRRTRVGMISVGANRHVSITDKEIEQALVLERLGFGAYDALHIAAAESGGAEVLLTTDDAFIRMASRFKDRLNVRVENPLTWVQEVWRDEPNKRD
jgi:predicted nucleic acid-binding protein